MPTRPPSDEVIRAIRNALHTEMSWDTGQAEAAGPGHNGLLLACLGDRTETWWRSADTDYGGETVSGAFIDQLGEALERIVDLPTDQRGLIGSLELLSVSRACLRLGAWRLLHLTLGTALHWLRADCPTPYRMSRLTGLVTEWALSADEPGIAMIYGAESLAWGAEPHRIRSYLAYSNECLPRSSAPVRNEIDLLLSTEATRLQGNLADRRIFGALHQLRLDCLRLAAAPDTCRGSLNDRIARTIDQLCTEPAPNQTPAMLAICIAAHLEKPAATKASEKPLDAALLYLRRKGRWRDLLLLSGANPGLPNCLTEEELSFLTALDGLADQVTLPGAGPVDERQLDSITTIVRAGDPASAWKRFLCCI